MVLSLNLEKYFNCDHFSKTYGELKIVIWDNEPAIYFALLSGDLIRQKNRSKLVEGSLFAIIDLLLGTKFITLYLIWRVGG